MKRISKPTIKRAHSYYDFIINDARDGNDYISSAEIARALNMSLVMVRIDIGHISKTKGKPRKGFIKKELINDIKNCLSLEGKNE